MSSPKVQSSRRKRLENLPLGRSTHPGLWLDKFLRTSDKEDTKAKHRLVEEVIKAVQNVRENPDYVAFFHRYRNAMHRRPGLTYLGKGKVSVRLSVGLGASSVLETSILLHRTYGVPYIPGSALKGLASNYALKYLKHEAWQKPAENEKDAASSQQSLHKLIFGDTDESGLVIFFDALPNPKDKFFLEKDIVTVHHRDYYQGKGKPPADWDLPTPVPFLTARGTFHFYLGLPPLPEAELEKGRKLLDIAARLLQLALKTEGVGAKTSLGYGRITFKEGFNELSKPKSALYKEAIHKVDLLDPSERVASLLSEIAALWHELSDSEKAALEKALQRKAEALDHPDLSEARKANAQLDALMHKLGY